MRLLLLINLILIGSHLLSQCPLTGTSIISTNSKCITIQSTALLSPPENTIEVTASGGTPATYTLESGPTGSGPFSYRYTNSPPNGCNNTGPFSGTVDYNGNTCTYSGGVLPVKLANSSISLKNGKVEISWTTATEINNDFFVIERQGLLQN